MFDEKDFLTNVVKIETFVFRVTQNLLLKSSLFYEIRFYF